MGGDTHQRPSAEGVGGLAGPVAPVVAEEPASAAPADCSAVGPTAPAEAVLSDANLAVKNYPGGRQGKWEPKQALHCP